MSKTGVVEIVLFAALFAALARQRSLRDLFRSLDPVRRYLLLGLIVMIPAGQLLDHNEWTYPWVVWSMYTDRRPGDVTWLDYTALVKGGCEVEWPVARQFSRIGKRVVWKLNQLDRDGQSALADRILVTMADRFNARHPGDPITAIRVWNCRQPMPAAGGATAVERTLARTVTVAAR